MAEKGCLRNEAFDSLSVQGDLIVNKLNGLAPSTELHVASALPTDTLASVAATGLTTGKGLVLSNTSAGLTGDGSLLKVLQTGATLANTTASILHVSSNGNGAVGARLAKFEANNMSLGTAVSIEANLLTSGRGLLVQSSSDHKTTPLVDIVQTGNAAHASATLNVSTTGQGGAAAFVADNATNATAVSIQANRLTNGRALEVLCSGVAGPLANTNAMVKFSATGDGAATHRPEGRTLLVENSGTTVDAGAAMFSAASLTHGAAVTISAELAIGEGTPGALPQANVHSGVPLKIIGAEGGIAIQSIGGIQFLHGAETTQPTSKTTQVTINKQSGKILLFAGGPIAGLNVATNSTGSYVISAAVVAAARTPPAQGQTDTSAQALATAINDLAGAASLNGPLVGRHIFIMANTCIRPESVIICSQTHDGTIPGDYQIFASNVQNGQCQINVLNFGAAAAASVGFNFVVLHGTHST